MSITSRINEMSSHIEQAYDELQGLGADLTNVNKNIENISMVLDDIYDSMPQVSGEGTSLTLDDTRVGKIKSTLKGNTSQTTYSGKNLLPYPYQHTTKTTNGITFTDLGNGSIKINGTASGNANFSLLATYTNQVAIPGNYVYGGTSAGVRVRVVNNTNNNFTVLGSSEGSSVQINKTTYTQGYVELSVLSGTTVNNVIITPMLTNTQDNTYEPYVGGTASPNPSYPQPVNVVSGDNSIEVCGKNITNWIQGNVNAQGQYVSSTTSVCTDFIKVNYNDTFTASKKTLFDSSVNDNMMCRMFDKDKNILGSIQALGRNQYSNSFTINNVNCEYAKFAQFKSDGILVSNSYELMVEKGNQATTYEPYIGNSYPIYLGVENLLDLTSLNPNQVGQQVSNIQENSFIMSGTAVWGNEYFFYENTNKNTTYTASCKYLSSLARKSGLSIYGTNETTGENLTTINSLLVDIPANVETPVTNTFNSGNYDYIVFRYWNNATATALSSRVDLYVKEVQLEKGSKANSYTPYGTTPIELCKIGTYQDYFYKDSGKWYLHKEIGKVVLDGTQAGARRETNTNNCYRFTITVDNVLRVANSDTKGAILCDKFVTNTLANTYMLIQGINAGLTSSDYYRDICIYCESAKTWTWDEFKTWLASNNVTLYYALATPINELVEYQPLIDQLNLLEKAMSKNGQTNISQVNNDLPFIISASALKEWQESTSLNSMLSMVNPLSLGNTLNTQDNNTQPIEVDNIEPLEEEENEES